MTLAYEIAGSGPTIALFHSGIADRRMWQPQWKPLLDAGYRVLRFDFAGFGETPAPAPGFNEAEDVLVLLDSLGIDDVTVVASSFGGRVAQEFAARWPSRVSRMLLVCGACPYVAPDEEIRAVWAKEEACIEAGDIDGATRLMVETFVGPTANDEVRALVATMQKHAFDVQIAAGDVAANHDDFDLGAITARTHAVWGGRDLAFFKACVDHLAEVVPGLTTEELDWAGHLPSLEDPARFWPVLKGFLREM